MTRARACATQALLSDAGRALYLRRRLQHAVACEEHDRGSPCAALCCFEQSADAGGLAKAEALGVATAVVDHRPYGADRAAFEAELQSVLLRHTPDMICLCGFMRVLTEGFTGQWDGRMLNIHPSLLPKYKGLHTHQRALTRATARRAVLFTRSQQSWMTGRSWGRRVCLFWRRHGRNAGRTCADARASFSILPCSGAFATRRQRPVDCRTLLVNPHALAYRQSHITQEQAPCT